MSLPDGQFPFSSQRRPTRLDGLRAGAGGQRWRDAELLRSSEIVKQLQRLLLESLTNSEYSVTKDAESVGKDAAASLSGLEVGSYHDCGQTIFKKVTAMRESLAELPLLQRCAAQRQQEADDFVAFFYEARLLRPAMLQNLQLLQAGVRRWLSCGVGGVTVQHFAALLLAVQTLFEALEMWRFKVTKLQSAAKQLLPCDLRLRGAAPTAAWCHCAAGWSAAAAAGGAEFVTILANEDVQLMDNSDEQLWLVRNHRGQTLSAPAPLIVIPAPSSLALQEAASLKVDFFNACTDSVKLVAKAIFWMVILGVHQYSDKERQFFATLTKAQVQDILFAAERFSSLFNKNWRQHPGFVLAMEKLKYVLSVMDAAGAAADAPADRSSFKEDDFFLFSDTTVLVRLLKLMESQLGAWTELGARQEVLSSEGHLLVHKDVGDLKMISDSQLASLWEKEISAETDGKSEAWDDPFMLTAEKYSILDASELRRHSKEEQTRYVITGVFDHKRDVYISLDDAIAKGIITGDMASFVNNVTWKLSPIAEAMQQQLIRVEATSHEVTKDEERSYGVITIRTRKETRPYQVARVRDPASGEWLGAKAAVKLGIFDPDAGVYRGVDPPMPLPDAVREGHLQVEYLGNGGAEFGDDEEVTQSFTVVGVVDQKTKKVVPFAEAVQQGLLDPGSGRYSNTATGDTLEANEAIRRGFLKVQVNDDPQSLSLADPERRAAKERLSRLRATVRAVQRLQRLPGAKAKAPGQT